MSVRRAVGIGCTSLAQIDDVVALVRSVIEEVEGVSILASLDRRATIARSTAARFNLEVMLFSAEQLSQVCGILTPSARVLQAVGTASVAEAAALAALGAGARIVVPRRTGRRCTCSAAGLA